MTLLTKRGRNVGVAAGFLVAVAPPWVMPVVDTFNMLHSAVFWAAIFAGMYIALKAQANYEYARYVRSIREDINA